MTAYMYPIQIIRFPKTVHFEEVREIESDRLTLVDLQFAGNNGFYVEERSPVGFVVTVYRARLETDDELSARVAREEAYMVEYNKRHPSTQ